MPNYRQYWMLLGLVALVGLSGCSQFKWASRSEVPVEEVAPGDRQARRNARKRTRENDRTHWARQKGDRDRRDKGVLADGDTPPNDGRDNGRSEATNEPHPNDRDQKPVPPRDKRVELVINEAKKYLGAPYRWGGTTKKGVDCSGLMVVAFKAASVKLPRVSGDQYKAGKPLKRKDLAPGDMVFFTSPGNNGVAHSGLVVEVIGKGDKVKFIHASSSKGVIISDLDGYYWRDHFRWACRVF
ncbi:MAG: C40 family peptidase [Bacteroidota bacterium]